MPFAIILSFCHKFRSAATDNERRRINEEQAAARRRARDAAAATTMLRLKAGGSVASTPVSECESLMESLLLDIRNGLGRRSLRVRGTPDDRPDEPCPSPDVTPNGSLRRRSRVSPGDDEGGLLEFLRLSSSPELQRDRKSWGSLDRSFSRRGAARARLEIPAADRERERTASPRPHPAPAPDPDPAPPASKPKEWRQKIECWLRANSQEEKQDEELRSRARRLHANRRSLEHDSESDRNTLDTLPEQAERGAGAGPGEWRPACALDKDVVGTMELVEDVQPQIKDATVPWRKAEENEDVRRIRRQRSRHNIDTQNALVSITEEDKRKQPPDIRVTDDKTSLRDIIRSNRVEIDSDNIETPPVTRKLFNPPQEREPCRKYQPEKPQESKDALLEILGDGQFDRFSATRRTRRYKRPTDSSSPEDEKPERQPAVEVPAETQVVRPTHLDVQTSYAVRPRTEVAEDKDHRLRKWQDRLKVQAKDARSPPTSASQARLRRQTSINQEDVQKAIRELKSPTETPAGVWSRGAYRSRSARTQAPAAIATDRSRITKVKSEHELNDEGFEETQSLNSESASQGASSNAAESDGASPPRRTADALDAAARRLVARTPPRAPADPVRRSVAMPKRASSLRVERSASRASLRSSRSSLNSSASVATVKRAPPPARPTPAPLKKQAARAPASRSSSSGSSVGAVKPPFRTSAGAAAARVSGFMRPTQASRGRTGTTPAPAPTPIRVSIK